MCVGGVSRQSVKCTNAFVTWSVDVLLSVCSSADGVHMLMEVKSPTACGTGQDKRTGDGGVMVSRESETDCD